MPFLFLFTVLAIVPSAIIGPSPAVFGVVLFIVANFGYQSALIYYDATLTMVSRPATRGRLSGIGVGVGYMGTIFAAVTLLLLGITDSPDPIFFVAGVLFAVFAIPIFLAVHDQPQAGVAAGQPAPTSRGRSGSCARPSRTPASSPASADSSSAASSTATPSTP